MTNKFTHLGLRHELLQAVAERGYEEPTPIQEAAIPLLLNGRDIIGQAQTGTGKTAAFALPILNNLTPGLDTVQCLVVAPTRELAKQVSQAIYTYGRHLGVRVLPIYGGQPYSRQIRRLKKGVDIVVGTPGRLLDLIEKKALKLDQVSYVVLDEADEMLSMGFIEDIESILQGVPDRRQTALFSATLPAEIRRLADRYLQEPEAITIDRKQVAVSTVEQRHYLVNEEDKLAALTRLFETETITQAIVFAQTRAGTGELANELANRGFPAEALSGDLSQEARERVLGRFRKDQLQVLVATDVAARGLDIDNVSHVFNFDLPLDPEVYVHRIGRTGRAGKSGTAISLASPRATRRLHRIQSLIGQKIARAELPTADDIRQMRSQKLQEKMLVWLSRDRCAKEKELVAGLVEEGFELENIAAVALKLAQAEDKQRPIEPVSELRSRSGRKQRGRTNGRGKNGRGGRPPAKRRSHEEGMVRLMLSHGRAHGLRPNDVVGTIAYFADIPGRSLGRITIEEERTLVDVPKQHVPKVLAKSGDYRIHRQEVTVQVA